MSIQMVKVFSLCSLLMALLFAVSASVQFNDTDWYVWIPLYTSGCIVNLANGVGKYPKNIFSLARFSVLRGLYLFIKVTLEGLKDGGISGPWSVDMKERLVREKIGSGLVTASMSVHLLEPLPRHQQPTSAQKGMLLTLVAIGYGLSALFYFCHHREMRF